MYFPKCKTTTFFKKHVHSTWAKQSAAPWESLVHFQGSTTSNLFVCFYIHSWLSLQVGNLLGFTFMAFLVTHTGWIGWNLGGKGNLWAHCALPVKLIAGRWKVAAGCHSSSTWLSVASSVTQLQGNWLFQIGVKSRENKENVHVPFYFPKDKSCVSQSCINWCSGSWPKFWII